MAITKHSADPSGYASINGSNAAGQTLTASNALDDADGLARPVSNGKRAMITAARGRLLAMGQAVLNKRRIPIKRTTSNPQASEQSRNFCLVISAHPEIIAGWVEANAIILKEPKRNPFKFQGYK